MLVKFLICSSIISLAIADVKHLSRTYLPPSPSDVVDKPNKLAYLPPVLQEAVPQTSEVTYSPPVLQEVTSSPNDLGTIKAHDELDVASKHTSDSEPQTVAVSMETSKDPIYGGAPFGGFPGAFPNPIYPRPVLPPQAYPGLGVPGVSFPPSAGFINPSFPGQFYPGQGFPWQAFPGQGYPIQGFPAPGFINPVFPGHGPPNYPIFLSNSEKIQSNEKEDNPDFKLLGRLINDSDTHYDDTNGGYSYKKPSVTF